MAGPSEQPRLLLRLSLPHLVKEAGHYPRRPIQPPPQWGWEEAREDSRATKLGAFLFDSAEFLYPEHGGQLPLVLQQNGVRSSLLQSSVHVRTLESVGTPEPIG